MKRTKGSKSSWPAQKKEIRQVRKKFYKEGKRVAKRAVAEAKSRAYKDFYKKLDTKEGQKHIFTLAKDRSHKKQDVEIVRYIKDEDGRVLLG